MCGNAKPAYNNGPLFEEIYLGTQSVGFIIRSDAMLIFYAQDGG